MRMTSHHTLIAKAELDTLKARYTTYLRRAQTIAGAYVAAGHAGPALPTGALVTKWFGALSAAQHTTLTGGLGRMLTCVARYSVNGGKPQERHVEWCLQSGTDLHNVNLFAAAYAYGVGNMNRHFTLRIYAGRGLSARSLGWKANTMFHELSHRILATADENLASGVTSYGTANCLQLVTESVDQALNNASNWAFFINECNGDTTDEA